MRARGWTDAAWDAAGVELAERGWLDGGQLSAEGTAVAAAIEADTDRLALAPWAAIGDAACDRLAEIGLRFTRARTWLTYGAAAAVCPCSLSASAYISSTSA